MMILPSKAHLYRTLSGLYTVLTFRNLHIVESRHSENLVCDMNFCNAFLAEVSKEYTKLNSTGVFVFGNFCQFLITAIVCEQLPFKGYFVPCQANFKNTKKNSDINPVEIGCGTWGQKSCHSVFFIPENR